MRRSAGESNAIRAALANSADRSRLVYIPPESRTDTHAQRATPRARRMFIGRIEMTSSPRFFEELDDAITPQSGFGFDRRELIVVTRIKTFNRRKPYRALLGFFWLIVAPFGHERSAFGLAPFFHFSIANAGFLSPDIVCFTGLFGA
jgi:hypothetical protein